MSVAVFNIAKSKDAFGANIEPLHEYVPGVIRCVVSFVAAFQDTVFNRLRIILVIPKLSCVQLHLDLKRLHLSSAPSWMSTLLEMGMAISCRPYYRPLKVMLCKDLVTMSNVDYFRIMNAVYNNTDRSNTNIGTL